MYPQSTILGRFVLLILVPVTLSRNPFVVRNDSLPSSKLCDIEGNNSVLLRYPRLEYICLLVSLPFLLLTFVVYSILPELQNMHGYTLRVHITTLFVTNVMKFCIEKFPEILSTWDSCLIIACILNFSSFSSLFWLNVICFDNWWTLRQLRSYRTNLKKQKKKLFILYSIYAWGISFTLNIIVYAILNTPDISTCWRIQPEMCMRQHLFGYSGVVYFYVPASVSVILNICFFIAVTLKIWNHGKQTDNQLRNSKSSRDNKNKYTIYVKLGVLLGISWVMKIILWMTDSFPLFIEENASLAQLLLWHTAVVVDMSQGVILFFAFVGTKKIKLLLLKRIGWQDRDPDNISSYIRSSTYSNTVTLISISPIVSMQEISLSNQQINHRVESYF